MIVFRSVLEQTPKTNMASQEESMARLHAPDVVVDLKGAESLHPDQSDAADQIKSNLLNPPVSPKQRQDARLLNSAKFAEAMASTDMSLFFLLGSTGTGKTTTFMLQVVKKVIGKNAKELKENRLKHGKEKYILVVPNNNLVDNAKESICGIYQQMHPEVKDPILDMDCNIHVINAFNSKGWHNELQGVVSKDKATLVICNASFFNKTMSYWFDNDWKIMYDEPDDKSNPQTSPTALMVMDMFRRKMLNYNIPSQDKQTNMKYFEVLREKYLLNGNSFASLPATEKAAAQLVRKLLVAMSKFKGKLLLSSATMPTWLKNAAENLGIPFGMIEMEKPSNPRSEVYLGHFDMYIEDCIREGTMQPMFNALAESVLRRLFFLNSISEQFAKNAKGDFKTQMDGFRRILVVLPGLAEVHDFTINYLESFLNEKLLKFDMDYHIVTPNNRARIKHELDLFMQSKTIDWVIEVIPSHEAQGSNFNALTAFLTPFRRARVEDGNQTILKVDMFDQSSVQQAKGRAGRLTACTLMHIGSKSVFEKLRKENKFNEDGMNGIVMGWASSNMSTMELKSLNNVFLPTVDINVYTMMKYLEQKNFVKVEDDHFQPTRLGKLSNIFYDGLKDYLNIEQHLVKHNFASKELLFKFLLWLQFYQNLSNGKNALFNFPEDQGIRRSMQQSRDFICAETNYKYVNSHQQFLWILVEHIHNLIMDQEGPYKGDFTALKRYKTYNGNEPVAKFVYACMLEPQTIRLCCVTAIDQLNNMEDLDILPKNTAEPTEEFNFMDYVKEKALEQLANGEIQLATRIGIDGDREISFYVDDKGHFHMVNHDLINFSADGSVVLIVHSVVKPEMQTKKMAMATDILPMTLFGSVNNMFDMLMTGLDMKLIKLIRDWMKSNTDEPPFAFVEDMSKAELQISYLLDMINDEPFIVSVSPLVYNLLRSITMMRKKEKELTPDMRRELYDYFIKLFKEHARDLSKTGATVLEFLPLKEAIVDMGIEQVFSLDKYDIDYDQKTLFTPQVVYLVTKKNHSKRGMEKLVFRAKCLSKLPTKIKMSEYQKQNADPIMETQKVIRERKERFKAIAARVPDEYLNGFTEDQITPRPCCALCGRVNSFNTFTTVLSRPKSDRGVPTMEDMNGMLITFHSVCLWKHQRDPDFGDYCPVTQGIMYNIGFNNIVMEPTQEEAIQKIKFFKMTKEEATDWRRIGLQEQADKVSFLLGLETPHTWDSIAGLSSGEVNDLHEAYMAKMEELKKQQDTEVLRKKREAELQKKKQEQAARKRQQELNQREKERAAAAKARAKEQSKGSANLKSTKGKKR